MFATTPANVMEDIINIDVSYHQQAGKVSEREDVLLEPISNQASEVSTAESGNFKIQIALGESLEPKSKRGRPVGDEVIYKDLVPEPVPSKKIFKEYYDLVTKDKEVRERLSYFLSAS